MKLTTEAYAEIFCANFTSTDGPLLPSPELGQVVGRSVSEAREHCPGIDLDEASFVAHLAQRTRTTVAGVIAKMGTTRAADLYLACACSRRDPAAIARFVELHLAGHEPEERQNLCDVLFTGEKPKIQQYRGSSPISNWLNRMSRNRKTDEHRRRAREVSDQRLLDRLEAQVPDPDRELWHHSQRALIDVALRSAFNELTPRDQHVFCLSVVDELSLAQVARVYGVDKVTIHNWLKRIQPSLQRRIQRRLVERGLSGSEQRSLVRGFAHRRDMSALRDRDRYAGLPAAYKAARRAGKLRKRG